MRIMTAVHKMKLQFKNGKFKILVIADLQDTNTPQKESIDMLTGALDLTRPNLVVFLGDNIAGDFRGVNKEKVKEALRCAFTPTDERQIPFAFVFGNHDCEGLTNKENKMTEIEAKEYILAVAKSFKNCVSERGTDKKSVCNFALPILSDNKTVFNLYFLDSGTYAPDGGYGYVNDNQIKWYEKKSEDLRIANSGKNVPSILFQHIVVPEVYSLFKESKIYLPKSVKGQTKLYKHFYRKSKDILSGDIREAPCCADVRHGEFQAWKNEGDILCAVFGHDHVNDFSGYVDDILMQAIPAAGYYSYGNHHGVGLITIPENNPAAFKIEIILSKDILKYIVLPRYKAQHGFHEYEQKKHIYPHQS